MRGGGVVSLPRLVYEFSEVKSILGNREWGMTGFVRDLLGPILGDGLILSAGAQHTALRQQLGHVQIPDLHAIVQAFDPPLGPCDLGAEMTRLAEQVIGALFGDADRLRGAGRLVRRCIALAPFRLIGLPLDWWWVSRLNKLLCGLPSLPWMRDQQMSGKERRDWAANFVIAGVDTLAADLTAQLAGVELLPIWWVPRRHAFTGETVILLLSADHKFGHGYRRCAGEYIARETARLVLQRFEVEIVSSDLRKVGLITQRLKRVTCYLRKRAAVSTCATDSAEVRP